jgi:hypothetical protein
MGGSPSLIGTSVAPTIDSFMDHQTVMSRFDDLLGEPFAGGPARQQIRSGRSGR